MTDAITELGAGATSEVQVPIEHCPTCEAPWVLRVSFVMTGPKAGKPQWLYQRDCRHKATGLVSAESAVLVVPDER